ncbi:hypothetical protein ACFLVS_07145, partial [Chloroflexota bacterium]
MQKQGLLWIVVLVVVFFLSFPCPAYAYMDPGTTGSIFAMFAPFIAIFLAFLGFLIRPFRRFIASTFTRLRRGHRAKSLASSEQPVLGDSPDDEKRGEDT